jgi:CubicO group peptidase (beta-lactamase class C family)
MSPITGFSGAVLVTRDEAVVLQASDGLADASVGVLCTPGTRFQIASVSKQLTAAMVMLLVDDGDVSLADPLGRYLPGCARRWRDLTLHQLLTHTSGLGHWGDLPGFDENHPGTPDEFLARFAEVPLRSTPGTTWRYSSPGYLVAARVIESVCTAAYADVLTERILAPLGLTASVVGRTPADDAAWGYRAGNRVDVPEFTAIPGTGDVWSTVDDLARYTTAFEAGEMLSQRSREAMVARQVALSDAPNPDDPAPADGYGYGYFLGTVGGYRARFHPGDNPGYQSFLAYLPDQHGTIAIVCNNEESDLNALLRQCLSALDPDRI